MMRFSEVAVFTDEVDAVADFYERLLGVAPTHRGDGIAVFTAGSIEWLVHKKYKPGPVDPPCESHVAIAVEDLEQAIARLIARGLNVEIPPRTYAWGRSAFLRDPDGRLLEIHQDRSETKLV